MVTVAVLLVQHTGITPPGAVAGATLRNIHLGVLMIPAACAVGVWLAGMSLRDVIAGFPINILMLVAGVTYFFGIAQTNGTIDRLIQKVLAAVGSRRGLLPYVIYLITTGVASMGSSQAGYVMIPLAMRPVRHHIDRLSVAAREQIGSRTLTAWNDVGKAVFGIERDPSILFVLGGRT